MHQTKPKGVAPSGFHGACSAGAPSWLLPVQYWHSSPHIHIYIQLADQPKRCEEPSLASYWASVQLTCAVLGLSGIGSRKKEHVVAKMHVEKHCPRVMQTLNLTDVWCAGQPCISVGRWHKNGARTSAAVAVVQSCMQYTPARPVISVVSR